VKVVRLNTTKECRLLTERVARPPTVEARLGSTIALDPLFAGTDALCGAVAALHGLWRGTIQLHKLGIVYIGAERAFDRFEIALVAVRR
jgi:hypothetical protein